MAIITRISVTVGGKINLGDYQNADRSVTVEAELLPGEDEFEAFDAVSQKAREWLASEIRELVENQLNAADLLGADEDTIRRRVRYAKGFAYLHSVDPDEADALVTDMVSELAAKAEPSSASLASIDDDEANFDPDDHSDFDGWEDEDDGWDDDDEDDEGPSDAFPRDDDEEDEEDWHAAGDAAEDEAVDASLEASLAQPLPDDEDTGPVVIYPDSTDTPNAGLN